MKVAIAGSTGLIGSQVQALAEEAGHEVVGIARQTGFDLLAPDGLEGALEGVDAVIDVTQGPSPEQDAATAFFRTVAGNLGRAAREAGVRRTVLLSIVGADKSPDYGYYVAKVAHEDATRESAPGPVVLRATQFHEFAGQMLAWNRDGDVTRIIDVETQPVAGAEVARLLLELAVADAAVDTELAGPQVERLVDQVRELVARSGEALTAEAIEAPASMASGSMLPDASAIIRGPRWEDWLDAQTLVRDPG